MGVERLELSRAYKAQRILNPQRLPFRHTGVEQGLNCGLRRNQLLRTEVRGFEIPCSRLFLIAPQE